MTALKELKKHLRPGRVYRRSELLPWSKSVDRHLKQLVEEGVLVKQAGGLYYYPSQTSFGVAPAKNKDLIRAFLKDDRFLLTSPNAYNALGVGSTQLYNQTVVYNHKRHGRFRLGHREYDFRMKPHFPKKQYEEFLLVDLVDNMDRLAESKSSLLVGVKERVPHVDKNKLARAVRDYGGAKAKKFFGPLLAPDTAAYAR